MGFRVLFVPNIIRIYHECEEKKRKIRPEDRRLASRDLPSIFSHTFLQSDDKR